MYIITHPMELPEEQKCFLMQHLEFSSALKDLWHQGDTIVEGIYNRKRCLKSNRRVIRDAFVRQIIRAIRRFQKYEMLRSSLEGLLFEQVPYLNEPHEIKFVIDHKSELKMTHVYFSKFCWELNDYERTHFIDKGEELTEADIAFILCFFKTQSDILLDLRTFVMNYTGQDRLGWRTHIFKHIDALKRAQNKIVPKLLKALQDKIDQIDTDN